MDKWPTTFAQASHGLVLQAYEGRGLLFCRACPIVRRPEGMVAIQGQTGATFTFTIQRDGHKEFGTILQGPPGYQASTFKVVPYNFLN